MPIHDFIVGLLRGQSIARILMNHALSKVSVSGNILDVGGARNPDYVSYLQTEHMMSFDVVDGSLSGIDFEVDPLPYSDASYDTIILCNVLEHIFNHAFLLRETLRVLRTDGVLVGFVPFLVQYHPDPHDYFRYTHEALEKLLNIAGYTKCSISSVGGGPFLVNFNTVGLSFPVWLRVLVAPIYLLMDFVFLLLRPKARERYPLGYVFTARK